MKKPQRDTEIINVGQRYLEKMWVRGGGRQIRMKWRSKESENDMVVYLMKAHEIHIERV